MAQIKSLLLALIFVSFGMNAWADNWDDLAAVKEHRDNMRRETVDDHYRFYIDNELDLACYAFMINQNKNNSAEFPKYNKAELVFKQNAVIDLSGHTWRAINELNGPWEGSIEGNNATIKNMNVGSCGTSNSGLIDVAKTEVTIKNLNMVDCTNNCNHTSTSILVGSVNSNATLNVENVTFDNCKVKGGWNSSIVVGYANGATVKMKGIKVEDCVIESSGKSGAGVGMSVNSTIKAESCTVENLICKGDEYVGGFLGKIEGNCKTQLNNIEVIYGTVFGNHYTGGIIGEWQGTGLMQNSMWSHGLIHSDSYYEIGGLVGKFYGSNTSCAIDNCLSDFSDRNAIPNHSGNIGGAVGLMGSNSAVTLTNVTVLTHSDYAQVPASTRGYIMGSSEGGCHITVENCHVDDGYYRRKCDVIEASFGANMRNSNVLVKKNINGQSTLAEDAKSNYYISMSNEQGSRMGQKYHPLTSTDGMLMRYAGKDIFKVSSYGIDPSDIKWNDYYFGLVGEEMFYSFYVPRDSWIVADSTGGMSNKKRLGIRDFQGTPTADLSQDRTLKFKSVPLPNVNIEASEYDIDRQCVTFDWSIDNEKALENQFDDAYWVVLCNNQVIADSVPFNTREYTDQNCPLGRTNIYKVKLVCKSLFFDDHQKGNFTRSIACDDAVNLYTSIEAGYNKIPVTTSMPNAKRFDGCRVSLCRFSNEDMVLAENEGTSIEDMIKNATPLSSTTFKSELSSNEKKLKVTLYDETNERPCTMFHYFVICDDFKDSEYQGRLYISNDVTLKPTQDVKLTSFTAAKGENTDKVRLTWDTRFTKTVLKTRYTVYRKKYNPDEILNTNASSRHEWVQIYSDENTNTTNSYTDETLPGYVYNYCVRASVGCDGNFNDDIFDDERYDIGYSASRGTIMGSITYQSGNTSVEGVDVRLAADSLSMGNKGSISYTRYFSGEQDRLPLAIGMGDDFWKGDWTLQFLLRPTVQAEERNLLSIYGLNNITINNKEILFGGKTMTLDPSNYTRMIICHKGDQIMIGQSDTPKETNGSYTKWSIVVKDKDVANKEVNTSDSISFGATPSMKSFKGLLDEVRLWNVALNETQVKSTYDRYLTGNESNLSAYYTFDSGVIEYAFDESHPDGHWNNHHSTLPSLTDGVLLPTLTSARCPSEEILCYRGTTDRNGEFQIAGIPYTGEGTNYMIVPIFGTHEFSPSSTRRYVSGQSLVHTGLQFQDVSSFPVPIQAYYALGNYPAEGLSVMIDNKPANDKEGKEIKTDINGRCTVSVPVGKHKLSIFAGNHQMVNEGYPCSITEVKPNGAVNFAPLQDADKLIDFQASPVAPFTFYDNTYARVAGRVVGGNWESEKPLGAGYSSANIGQVSITLEPSVRSGYNLNNQEDMDVIIDKNLVSASECNDSIASTTTYKRMSSQIVIDTDPVTGEFLAMIPPVSMRITDIHTTGKNGELLWEDFNTGNQTDLITIDMMNEEKDTIVVDENGKALPENMHRAFHYNVKKNFTYFVDPEIKVVNSKSKDFPLMFGDKETKRVYEETDSKGNIVEKEDVIPFWNPDNHDGTSASYLVGGVPIFTMGDSYSFDISLYERYHNCDTGKDSLYYIPNVELQIKNNLATMKAVAKMTDDVMSYTLREDSIPTAVQGSANGITTYEFTAGFPNPLPPYTLDMTMSYTTNGKVYTYPEEGSIKGIVMGAINVPGSDFVTAGPNIVSFVLRDPPGGSSYSWIEQGSTVNASISFDNIGIGSQDVTDEVITSVSSTMTHCVPELVGDIMVGFEINFTNGSKTLYSTEGGLATTWKAGEGQSNQLSYTTTQRLQTSSAPKFIGSAGDVYVGSSTNFVFSKNRTVGIRKSATGDIKVGNHTYALEEYEGQTQTVTFPTVFSYTQNHILNQLIPDWKNVRRTLVTEVVSDFSQVPEKISGKEPRYYVLPTTSDEKDIWESGKDYKCVFPNDPKLFLSDSICTINNFIESWQESIRHNEEIKAKSFKESNSYTYEEKPKDSSSGTVKPDKVSMEYGFMGNVSLDAGVSLTKSITRDKSTTDTDIDDGTVQAVVNHTHNYSTSFFSLGTSQTLRTKFKEGYQHSGKAAITNSNKQTFGYTLADSSPDNYYSIDTWLPGEMTESGTFKDLNNGGKPKFDEFYVFRLAGGQSRCPYEGEEYSLFYKEDGKPVKLSNGTIAIEEPKLSIEQTTFTDIPNAQSMTFPITLSNTSSAIVKSAQTFTVATGNDTNPDGLEFYIDGVILKPRPTAGGMTSSGGYELMLQPGQSVQKMVTVKQSKTDVTHYENVTLCLYSSGDPSRISTETLNFHYKPASSPVTLTLNSNIVNNQTPDEAVVLNVSNYQPDFEKFAGIRIQYKTPTEMDWHTATVLVNDSALIANTFGEENFPDVWEYLDRKADYTRVKVPLTKVAEGEYQFRAQSFSPNGMTDEVTTESDVLSVIKDTTAPSLLTRPTPVNGYYTGVEDISIEMNEPIDMQLLTDDNFTVTGVLNDAEVSHMSGLHFDGSQPARTQSRVNIFGNSSTIAFWYKPNVDKTSCLVSQNVTLKDNQTVEVALHYNNDASLSLWLNGNEYKSTRRAVDANDIKIDDWMYATIIVNREESEIDVYNLFGTSTQAESHFLHITNANIAANCNVPLYIGGSPDGDKCYADIEELVIYRDAQEFATVAENKNNRHNENLSDLLGYWPMDEGNGLVAADKVRNRNLHLEGTDNWYMPVTNYCVNLNGNDQFVRINTAQCAISRKQDYVLEMYFRSASDNVTNKQTIFSNGWGGEGSPEASLSERLSISLNPGGGLLLEASGKSYSYTGNYADRNWHHLVLDVKRSAYARLLVDGQDVGGNTNIAGTDLGGLANAKMTLGALIYNGSDGAPVDTCNYFAGDIDEIRLWNAYRSDETIKLFSNSRLTGNEVGLVAYYPFEKASIVSNQVVTKPYKGDCVVDNVQDRVLNASTPDYYGNPQFMTNGARLKASAISQPVAIEFTHDENNRIVLRFPENLDKRRIEGCTLTFSVRRLQDLAGNKMNQPTIWNLFVEQKSLSAILIDKEIRQEIGHSQETSIILINNKPTSQIWTLSSLPDWLTAEKMNGTIEPFGITEVALRTSEAASVGNHSATLLVSGEDGLSSYLNISLKVTSVRPDWDVANTDGSVWMSLLGRLKVGNDWSADEDDMVAAFTDDGRILGLASPVYNEDMSTYFLHMNIKGNADDNNKNLHFCVWDASTNITYTDTEINYMLSGNEVNTSLLKLQSTRILGDFTNPCTIATLDTIRQSFDLHQGWNWISFWVDPKVGRNANNVLADILPYIKDVKARVNGYKPETLSKLKLSLAEAYMIYATDPVSFSVEGTKVNPADVKIYFKHSTDANVPSWQWLGFPLYATQTLASAFADFNPAKNDIVKSEDAYAMFNGKTWIGDLKYLSPGKGYMYGYHADDYNDIWWFYPDKARNESMDYELDVDPYKYENYTFVTVIVQGMTATDSRYQLLAKTDDGTIHGVASNTADQFHLNIFGNEGEQYNFVLYDRQTGNLESIGEPYPFDAITPEQTVTIVMPTGLQQTLDADDKPNWYNVNGIRLGTEKPTVKGVYINNGKKQVKK